MPNLIYVISTERSERRNLKARLRQANYNFPKRTRCALARLVKRRECLQEVEFSTCSARRKLPPGANELKLCRNEIAACEGEFADRAQRKNQFNNLAQNCSICANGAGAIGENVKTSKTRLDKSKICAPRRGRFSAQHYRIKKPNKEKVRKGISAGRLSPSRFSMQKY